MTVPRSDAAAVYGEIRRGIVEGRYPPGGRLIEQRLAEEQKVSRTPVREAVRRLEAEGLVIVERNRGAQVRPLCESEIRDLYDVRARLEGYAAELAADRGTPEEVSAVQNTARSFSASVDAAPASERDLSAVRVFDQANARFHNALHQASHHSRIPHLIKGSVDAPLVFQALRRFEPAELRRSALFHELIAEAVAESSGDRARRLMTEHVLQGRDSLLEQLFDAGGVEPLFARGA